MKKLLLSLSLLSLSATAYCGPQPYYDSWWEYFRSLFDIAHAILIWSVGALVILSPFIIVAFVITGISWLLEWYASDVENHPERRIIVNIMYIILGILTLGMIFLNRKK